MSMKQGDEMMERQSIQGKGAGDADLADGRWLALDTSTAAMALALLEGGRLLAASRSLSERNHSIRLIPAMRELLRGQGLTMRDLNGIAAGVGPGSYTGVRIAVTVAKTQAWALGLPLAGVSSLAALAHGCVRELLGPAAVGGAEPGGAAELRGAEAEGTRGAAEAKPPSGKEAAADGTVAQPVVSSTPPPARIWVAPLLDARRGQAYTGLYEFAAGRWAALEPDGIRDAADWLQALAAKAAATPSAGVDRDGQSGQDWTLVFVGDVFAFGALLDAFQPACPVRLLRMERDIEAYDIGLLALRRRDFLIGEEIHGFVPNYTQLAEAEKKLQARMK